MSLSGSVKMLKSAGCNLSDSGSTRSTKFRFLSWSPETYPLREFINMFPLPRVVRITNSEDAALLKALILPADVDITQPLLLYKKYRTVKVVGKCLKIQKNGKLKENGPSVVIPDSFPGWFTLLNQDGKECAMTLTSMGQVAVSRVPAFLTKFDVPVYKLTDSNDPNNKSVYIRSTMKGGSILRLLGVWADLGGANKGFTASASSYTPQKSSCFLGGSLGGFGGRLVARSLSTPQPAQFQYVQCLSLENEVLFIPFSAAGVFYPIAPRGGRNPQHVYPLSAISRISKLPLRTRMVCGAASNSLSDFTGALQIESVDTEDVILACTLLRDKPLLFEIDLDCDLSLSQMTSEDLFIQSTGYQTALNYCRTEAETWRRQIRPTLWGKNTTKGGTVTGAYLLSVKEKKKSLRIGSSPHTPSKLSLLFRPNSAPFGHGKDALRRSKSFNVEVQSVSISLTQDEEEEETKKLSTLFNFMAGKKNKTPKEKQHHNHHHQSAQHHYKHHPLPPALLSPPSHHRHLLHSSFGGDQQPLSLPCNIMTSEKDLQKDKDDQELVVQHSQISKIVSPQNHHHHQQIKTKPQSNTPTPTPFASKSSQQHQQLSHSHLHQQVQQQSSKKLQLFNQPKSISHLSNNYHHALRRRQLLNRSVPDVLSNHSSSSIPTMLTSSSSTSNNQINNTNNNGSSSLLFSTSSNNSNGSSNNNHHRISIITGSNGSSSCSNLCSSSSSFPSSNNNTGSSSSGSLSGPCSKIILSNNSKKLSSSSSKIDGISSSTNPSNLGKNSCTGSHHHLLHSARGSVNGMGIVGASSNGGFHSAKGSKGEVPYGTVLDDVTEEENIYAEISDAFTLKLDLNPIHQMGIDFHHHLRHTNSSNMSSLVKGGGGSDGAFSGTLSGTFSSSNPSSREEDIYDAVF